MFFATLYGENTDSALPLLNLLDLLTVKNIFSPRLLQFSHQWHKKQLPSIFDNHIRYASDVHSYNTRYASKANFYKARFRTFSALAVDYSKKLLNISVFPTSLETLNGTYYRNKYNVLANLIPLIYVFE